MGNVYILIGFDCDRPRGDFIRSSVGREMAERKLESLKNLRFKLDNLEIPRTYFICGQFLESMSTFFSKKHLLEVFSPRNTLCEIADHSYSHNVWKAIPSRRDKFPLTPSQIVLEYHQNSKVFSNILDGDFEHRGVRSPLGYYQGLSDCPEIINALVNKTGALYVSTDLRDRNHSINPPLLNEIDVPRQPYFYDNQLLEIPSHGWHDTVYGNGSNTPVFESFPQKYEQILEHHREEIFTAQQIANQQKTDFYLGKMFHPYDVSFYDLENHLFDDLKSIAQDYGASFKKYRFALTQLTKDTSSS